MIGAEVHALGFWRKIPLPAQTPANRSVSQTEIISLLRSRGYTSCQQKADFIAAICAKQIVENPEELWLYLKSKNSTISIAAVYYNLRLMVNERVMIKIPTAGRYSIHKLVG